MPGTVSARSALLASTWTYLLPPLAAWQDLQDGGAAVDLGDVNEGLGQTHRGRLQQDESVREYTGEEFHRGGYFRGGRGYMLELRAYDEILEADD